MEQDSRTSEWSPLGLVVIALGRVLQFLLGSVLVGALGYCAWNASEQPLHPAVWVVLSIAGVGGAGMCLTAPVIEPQTAVRWGLMVLNLVLFGNWDSEDRRNMIVESYLRRRTKSSEAASPAEPFSGAADVTVSSRR